MRAMDLMDNLSRRGLIQQQSDADGIAAHLAAGSQSLYCGFDPTAASLHVGNLLPLMALRRFQLAGHRPIALVGGGTGLIGDPSGKNEERTLNSTDVVQGWAQNIRTQAEKILDFEAGDQSAIIVDNYDWLSQMSLIDYLRDIGKYFSVSAMLARDSVKTRIDRESGISYTEFSYMLLQSIDFLELQRRYGCLLQIGGSDQWGNMVSGVDLVRRATTEQAYCFTFPLITTSDGKKFGKSEGNAIWLDAALTSSYNFYQYWMNVTDEDVGKLLRYFTYLSIEDIDAIETDHAAAPHKRDAQRRLAQEVTRIVHGQDAVDGAERATEALFGKGDVRTLTERDLLDALAAAPSYAVTDASIGVAAVLKELGLVKSVSDGRRQIKAGGVSLNGEKVSDEALTIDGAEALFGRHSVFRVGKKRYGIASLAE